MQKGKIFQLMELDQWVCLTEKNNNLTPSSHHIQNLFPGKLKSQL